MKQPITSKPSSSSQQGSQSDSDRKQGFQISAPSISLPKGGGAIRGMGEKFAANPVTGTGSITVPIATSPGRSGFGPQLSLTYDSGAGNGPFGFGWSLSLPSITRKTDKGLPKYQDAVESDVFILSGAEDLVPRLIKDAQNHWIREPVPDRTIDNQAYRIQLYRPRIEGLFARIERWTNKNIPEDVFWRSISKDNITTWYGRKENSRIYDPNEKRCIFSWLICESYDDKGNVIVYEYKGEDSERIFEDQQGQFVARANERNRTGNTRKANRYLKRIYYGNREPYLPKLQPGKPWPNPPRSGLSGGKSNWFFEVVFDYDDGHYSEETTDAEGRVFAKPVYSPPTSTKWKARIDPFSTYRAGFEVRTYRLCQRVLMFHHFPDELGTPDYLVRSTDFTYSHEDSPNDARNPIYSFLTSTSQSGYVRQADGSYLKKSLPPLQFEYTKPEVQAEIHDVDAQSLENLPYGLDGSKYQWVDLDGEGVSGIVTEQGDAWYYKRNLSPLPNKTNGKEEGAAHFGPLELVAKKPSLAALSAGGQQFLDLAGDGQLDLVALSGPTPGFFERTHDEHWEAFRTFQTLPNVDWSDPQLKFVDLTGDGHADILITEDDVFWWYPSLAEAGFGPAERVAQNWDEEKGPRLVFADIQNTIHLADLSGDGLSDLVRIRNGEVCYWPNLGYGRFGAKVTMDSAPWFDHPDQFDPRRIQLADIDGSGTTDIIYVGSQGVDLYFNQSGNSWSKPHHLDQYPQSDSLSSVTAIDLLGNGTACLVWSSPLPGDARRPMRYVDLMGRRKPHLLVKTINNLGAETRVDYAPSTKFYLHDKRDGKPWITRLPFPVHVVECVETYDHISRNRFVTRYAYHHGYFDGVEREFRGFGMVEELDTEELAALTRDGTLPVATNFDSASHVPPVHTKTWFHTGIHLGHDRVSNFFAGLLDTRDVGEYYPRSRSGDAAADAAAKVLLLDDTVLPTGLTLDEEREACRALKGSILRQEVYALDGTTKEPHPYTVAEQNFTIRRLQSRDGNRHGVFFAHPREAITYHYERNPSDPRTQHALTLEVDDYGNVRRQATIGYGRRVGLSPLQGDDKRKQEQPLITYSENGFTNEIEAGDEYRIPLSFESRTYEVTGLRAATDASRFTFEEIAGECNAAALLDYEKAPTSGQKQKRLIEHVRTLYRKNDLTNLLPLNVVESLALPGESYKLAFTPGLLDQVFRRDGQALLPNLAQVLPVDAINSVAADRGGYVDLDGNGHWWVRSGRIYLSPNSKDNAAQELAYAREHFFLPLRYRDPFHTVGFETESTVKIDTNDLLMVETCDALGNRVIVDVNDYRVLQPRLVSDPNRNRTEVAFDTLGMVVGTAVMGKPPPAPVEGDTLAGFAADLTPAQLDQFMAAPRLPSANPKESEATQIVHNLLQKATTRIVYDLDRFKRLSEPPFAATIARETHVSNLASGQRSKLQIGFSYSDGFGREIQKKIQAESGPVPQRDANGKIIVGANGQPVMTLDDESPRWVGSGWTIFNNKGKPVRQYEPFFTGSHRFEFDVRIGVSPVLFYDPAERIVATLHPNHTYEKVVFDPWQQTTYDANDTVTSDPKSDADVGGNFQRLRDEEFLPSWHALRTEPMHAAALASRYPDAGDRAREAEAAAKASGHADTPTTVHFDALGRPFLTVARNRVVCSGHPLHEPTADEDVHTRVELDIEGNQREVRDQRKLPINYLPTGALEQRIVMRYAYDMLGNPIHQASMEAGERWMLNDVAGKLIRAWDSRGHNFTTSYDALRRPVAQTVRGTSASSDARTLNRDILFGKIEYGEGVTNAEALNIRTRIYRHLDLAGEVVNAGTNLSTAELEAYDFKGNLLRSSRRIAKRYKEIPDWSQDSEPQLDTERFESSTRYDAFNRPIQAVASHSSLARAKRNVIQPVFNEASLLDRMDVWLERASEPSVLLNPNTSSAVGVTNIDYNAKGQRLRIDYKNGISTFYDYHPLTFRLTHLLTRRDGVAFPDDCPQPPPAGWPGCQVQNLHYTYDPAGNITHVHDDAQQTIYFKNKRVEPSNDYTYDALYRLIQAKGREHLGQAGGAPIPHSYNDAARVGLLSADAATRFAPNDGNAMGNYTERYVYDAVGNFLQMLHERSDATAPGWTRRYAYAGASLIESGKQSNRLSSTTVGSGPAEPYSHDAHGNMLQLPQLQAMQWDYRDQLLMTQRQKVNDEDADGVARHGERTWYVYDASGQRVRKVTELANGGGIKDERIYLGGAEIFRGYEGPGSARTLALERETLHVMDDKQRIALVETRTLGNDPAHRQLIRYQCGNHLGSSTLELDDEAQIISYEEYAPYGSTTYQAVRSQTETPKRYRYTGMERDEESGLNYHSARYYAAWLGRWTAADQAGLGDGPCLYTYSRCRPSLLRDPSGHQVPSNPQVKVDDVVRYNQKLVNRNSIGANPQKDHVINQAKQKLINPNVNTSTQLTVVQETGKAAIGVPAKPHTLATFHDVQSDVAETARIEALLPEQWTSFEQEVITPSLQSRYRSGYRVDSANISVLDIVGSFFEIDQPNRAPNSSPPNLQWRGPQAVWVGPRVDPKTGRVIDANKVAAPPLPPPEGKPTTAPTEPTQMITPITASAEPAQMITPITAPAEPTQTITPITASPGPTQTIKPIEVVNQPTQVVAEAANKDTPSAGQVAILVGLGVLTVALLASPFDGPFGEAAAGSAFLAQAARLGFTAGPLVGAAVRSAGSSLLPWFARAQPSFGY